MMQRKARYTQSLRKKAAMHSLPENTGLFANELAYHFRERKNNLLEY